MAQLSRGLVLSIMGLVLLNLMTGCAGIPTKPADYANVSFNAEAIEHMVIMPVLDFRFDKEKELDLDNLVHKSVENELKRRNYQYTCLKERALIDAIEPEDLEELKVDWVSDMEPGQSQWLLFIALLDSSSKLTFGSTGSAEMTAYLVDKDAMEIVWRNKEIGRMGQGGLVGMMMKGAMESSAIQIASSKLMHALPVRGQQEGEKKAKP